MAKDSVRAPLRDGFPKSPIREQPMRSPAPLPGLGLVAVLAIAVLAGGGIGAAFSLQSQADPPKDPYAIPPGVAIELLGLLPDLPRQPQPTTGGLARYTVAAGAAFDLAYPGAVLVAVEAGTLTLDAVGPAVSLVSPPVPVGRNARGKTVRAGEGAITRQIDGRAVRQEITSPAAGSPATVAAAGWASAPDGQFGPARNTGAVPLRFLVVSVVSDPPPSAEAESTRIAVPPPPG
jgi:hypothetical protein